MEAEAINADLNRKAELIRWKLDYLYKLWSTTDFPMSNQKYDEKFDFFMVRDVKLELYRTDDKKFRHSTHRFQNFYYLLPVIQEVLDRPKYHSLKEFLFGSENMDFQFSEEWLEAKTEFMFHHSRQVQRTEKIENTEFHTFLTSCENIIKYCLGDEDSRQPLRDPFRR